MFNLHNSSKIETTPTISKGCQPLARVKDKDSSSLNISLSPKEAKQKKMELYKNLTPEQHKSWSNLHLYELACSRTIDNPRLKEINSG